MSRGNICQLAGAAAAANTAFIHKAFDLTANFL